jgi:hypothetical protein
LAILELIGVTAIDASVAGFTVSVVDSMMLPAAAEIVVDPAANEAANPEALTVTKPVLDGFQATCVVRSCVVLSENVPMAVNCRLVPLAMLGLVGVIARDTSVALVTVSVVASEMFPEVAVMVVIPAFFPYA